VDERVDKRVEVGRQQLLALRPNDDPEQPRIRIAPQKASKPCEATVFRFRKTAVKQPGS
jgi:hypothetical protein